MGFKGPEPVSRSVTGSRATSRGETLGCDGPDRGAGDPANSRALRDLISGRLPSWWIRQLEDAPLPSVFPCGVISRSLRSPGRPRRLADSE